MDLKRGDVYKLEWADGFFLGLWECKEIALNGVATGVMISGKHITQEMRFTSEMLEGMERIWREGDGDGRGFRSGLVSEGL